MGKKIKVVDIVNEEPTPTTDEVIADVEPEQVIVDDTPTSPTDVVSEETLTQIEVTPKPKAKPRIKKKETVAPPPEVPTLEVEPVKEVVEEVQPPSKEKVKKVVEQVKCPKCDKMMSQKSLRYTHEQNCKGEVVKTEDLPVKRRITKQVEPKKNVKVEANKKDIYNDIVGRNVNIETSEVQIPEELKLEVFKSIQKQQERLKLKENNLNKLRMQIF
jgi:hypothetical protein